MKDRTDTAKWIAALYDVRSQLLHEGHIGKLPELWISEAGSDKHPVQISMQVIHARNFLRDAIGYCIENLPGASDRKKLLNHADHQLLK